MQYCEVLSFDYTHQRYKTLSGSPIQPDNRAEDTVADDDPVRQHLMRQNFLRL